MCPSILGFHLPSHHHQQVIATRWMVSQLTSAPSLPPTSHCDSLDGPSAFICPQPPPTSHDDSLDGPSASICPQPPPTSYDNSLDGPSASISLNHHQQVTTTCWLVSRPSSALSQPPTSHRDS